MDEPFVWFAELILRYACPFLDVHKDNFFKPTKLLNLHTFDKNWYAIFYSILTHLLTDLLTYSAFAFCTCGKSEILRTQKLYSQNHWSCSKWVGDKMFKTLHLSMNIMWVLITKIVINTFVVWINAIHSRIFVLILLIADMYGNFKTSHANISFIFIAQKNLIVWHVCWFLYPLVQLRIDISQ